MSAQSMPNFAEQNQVTNQSPQKIAWSEETEAVLVDSICHNFSEWKKARTGLEAQWQACWEAYLCELNPLFIQDSTSFSREHEHDRSRVARPVLYEAVEAIHSHLLNGLFPASEKFFTVMGQTEGDMQNSQLIESFLQQKLEDANFIEQYALFLKQAIVTGNSVAALPWHTQKQRRPVEVPIKAFGVTINYETQWQDCIQYDGPKFDVLDIFDVVMDPETTDFTQAKLIRKVSRTLSELKENPAYTNLDKITFDCPESHIPLDNAPIRNPVYRHHGLRAKPVDHKATHPLQKKDTTREPQVTVLEAWGDFWVNDTLYANHLCVIAGKTLIRFEPNPYHHQLKPFVFTNFIAIPNALYGIGAIEKSLGLQHAINTLTNQKLDVINLSINNPFTYLTNDDDFDPANMVTRPGALIPVKSHETLKPIRFLNNFTVAFQEIETLKAEIQEATGALTFFTGGESDRKRTATEVSALVRGGTQKFSSILSHLEKTSLLPALQLIYRQAKQFVSHPQPIRCTCDNGNPKFETLTPAMIRQSGCQFKIDGSKGLLLKEQELTAISNFIALVEKSPDIKASINLHALYKKIYRRLGFADEAEIFSGNPAANQ
ncbi:MAG: portal protein [Cyanobacteria bacterium P01_H01_bin.74]